MAARRTTDDALVEARARASLEQCYQRALSDAEWDCAKRDLLALVKLLTQPQASTAQPLTTLAFADERE